MQLEDDGSETSAGLVEEVEASFQGLAFFRFVALVYCVMPHFPSQALAVFRFAQTLAARDGAFTYH